jgi:RNA polymerase sigma-70 factor (ECF subfamily)
MCRESSRAEELTQDVFVRAWQMLHTFRGESAFSSWLHRVAINVVLADIRSAKRRTARIAVVDDGSLEDAEERVSIAGSGIDLEHAVASLPPQARTVFVLHDIEGYRHEEIAVMMGIATGTSKAQLHRARKLLKEVLR